jgi:hypothetical protein
MNLYCSGQGATTEVFDRAGLRFSDPAKRPNTSENVAEDLHKLLAGVGINPPYVMVAEQNSYCTAAARIGFKPGSEEQMNCIGNPTETYGPTLGTAVMSVTCQRWC